MLKKLMVIAVFFGCGLSGSALGQNGQAAAGLSAEVSNAGVASGAVISWDDAFEDRSGNTAVHFVAQYLDFAAKTHQLEEWRVGLGHLRRRTDDRIDLHADAASAPRTGQPVDYIWQILDLEKKIDHRVSSKGMMRAGMLYSYYAMAHVLSRPAGRFEVHVVQGLAPATQNGQQGRWFEISASGQPSTRVCWSSRLGIPLRMMTETQQGWRTNFEVRQLDTRDVGTMVFAVNLKGFQVRNVEELEDED